MIAHPGDVLPGREVVAVVAGPAIYLLGHTLFRLRLAGSISWRRLGGAVACLAAGFCGTVVAAVWVEALVCAILVAVIALEHLAAARRGARSLPSPLERLDTAER